MTDEILSKIEAFIQERDWPQFHNGKDLECSEKIDRIEEELADVFIYASLIALKYKLNISTIVEKN